MEQEASYNVCNLIKYVPPSWASKLKYIPQHFVRLAQRFTPIHEWKLPNLTNFELYIKRDDMTGSVLSGNKIRKLEFLLADALFKKCKYVMTAGGIQSNHCRATAVAARQLGLSPYLFLCCDGDIRSDIGRLGCNGNLFLDSMVGSKMFLVDSNADYDRDILPKMSTLSQHLKDTNDGESYLIPFGGSNVIGLFGYIECFNELIEQGLFENFDDIVVATGSGGTICGLAIANYLTGLKVKLHSICVSDNAEYFYSFIDDMLKELQLQDEARAHDIVDIIEGHIALGTALSTRDELDYIHEVSRSTGIILDPVCNIKAVKGMMLEMQRNPDRFQGHRILYICTGGIFEAYDGRLNPSLEKERSNRVDVVNWTDFSASFDTMAS